MVNVVTKVSEYSQLVKGGLYTNNVDVRKLISVQGEPSEMEDWRSVQWQGKQHKGDGGAICTAKSFKKWVNTKPKDLPQVVYSNTIQGRMGMKSTDHPFQCIWDEHGKGWCSFDGDHAADVLGLLQHDGVWTFTSVNEAEVIAWMRGVKSAIAAMRSFCGRTSIWGRLPLHS